MGKRLIAILTDVAVGGTFLSWSLHYLAGHKKYYHAKSNQWLDVIDNPMTLKNAHGFRPNQPISTDASNTFNLIHSSLLATPVDTFHTIYVHNHGLVTTSYNSDLEKELAEFKDDPTIVLTLAKEHHLYQCSYYGRGDVSESWAVPGKKITTDYEKFDDFITYFFKDSLDTWNNLKLTNVWDQREFLALNINPKNVLRIEPNITLSHDHYALDTMELWNTFDLTIIDLFNYLGLKLDDTRKAQWDSVYYSWRRLHYRRLLFVWYFDKIISYIIEGNNLDLTRFNLDIVQEAAIQHELIYSHNLNLKTWQLEKFTNTKQLHYLLEPNIHDLSKSKVKH